MGCRINGEVVQMIRIAICDAGLKIWKRNWTEGFFGATGAS